MAWTAVLAVAVAAWGGGVAGMTMTAKEAAALPDELKPIMPGGSWFDDMAVKRLRLRHKELKQLDRPEGEDDPEEKFILAKLKDPEITLLPHDEPQLDTHTPSSPPPPPTPAYKTQDTREALRSFLRHHTAGGEGEGDNSDRISVTTSREFMEVYERELHNFFEKFMRAMLQAEIGGVSIENRSEERKEPTEGFPVDEVAAQANAVINQ